MILPLVDQVAPLALCQRLKELGAPQETLCFWSTLPNSGKWKVWLHGDPAGAYHSGEGEPGEVRRRTDVAAYTVAELGAMLPNEVNYSRMDQRWSCAYIGGHAFDFPRGGETESESRAALLIALIERGVVKFERKAT